MNEGLLDLLVRRVNQSDLVTLIERYAEEDARDGRTEAEKERVLVIGLLAQVCSCGEMPSKKGQTMQ